MFYGLDEASRARVREGFDILQPAFRKTFAADMLITFNRSQAFESDAAFMQAFNACAANPQEESLIWRLHTLCWAAGNALRLDGDFVECGVFRGFCSAVAARYLDFKAVPKRWYLYDTFTGIPADQLNTGHEDRPDFADPDNLGTVRERFAGFTNIEIVQGRVPEVFATTVPARIAFLHLDLNSAAAELGALEVLFDRVVDGGFILLDDYGQMFHEEQQVGEDAFFAARGLRVLELPTGQGLVVKSPLGNGGVALAPPQVTLRHAAGAAQRGDLFAMVRRALKILGGVVLLGGLGLALYLAR